MSGKKRVKFRRPTSRNEDSGAVCGAWVPRSGSVTDAPSAFLLLGRNEATSSDNAVAVREYNFDTDTLSDVIHAVGTHDGHPLQLVVHPTGTGVLCAFANSCKYFEIVNPNGPVKLKASELELPLLQGIGIQSCIRFNGEGSVLVTGGKDGHLRVFAWPACELALDEPGAHRSIQDLDIRWLPHRYVSYFVLEKRAKHASLPLHGLPAAENAEYLAGYLQLRKGFVACFSYDSAYVASMAEDSACRVWDIAKGESIAQLQQEKDNKFGCCRFSRDGSQAFLFVSITKGNRGYIGVWNMADWSKIGSKQLANVPISALAVTRDGKFLGLGTTEGDLIVVIMKKMEAAQLIGSAHVSPVTELEFSKHGRSLLSMGADSTARVSRLQKSEWREWQLYALLIAMILLSGLLFLLFFESSISDDFWQFPMGRAQPARPPPETVWSHPRHKEL